MVILESAAPSGKVEKHYLEKMSKRRPTILLTGFGPFPGVPENATAELVPEVAREARKRWPGFHVETAILPTEWRAAPDTVVDLITELKPAVALHFGVSSSAHGFTIESRGENRARPICDAAGLLPPSERLSPDGPDVLAASFPASHIVERLRKRSLPVSLSRDAGGYLCNAVLYRSLEGGRRVGRAMRCGFVHVPTALGRKSGSSPVLARLSWEQAISGSLEIIAATLGQPFPA